MTLIQILILIFAIFALSRAALQIRRKGITHAQFFFWALVWLSLIVFALVPSFTSYLSRFFGIDRGVDLFVYIGLVVLFYSMFRIYVMVDRMRQEITVLTREIAIINSRKKK